MNEISRQSILKRKRLSQGDEIMDVYNDFSNLRQTNTNLKLEIIKLEGLVREERGSKNMLQQKYNSSVRELEHLKLKSTLDEAEANDSESVKSIDCDIETLYFEKESLIRSNEEMKALLNDAIKSNERLEFGMEELEIENGHMKSKIEEMDHLKEQLNKFLEENRSKLMKYDALEVKIIELENANSSDKSQSCLVHSLVRLQSLDNKCLELEKENAKFRQNHNNLRLLMEENSNLSSKIIELRKQISEHEQLNLSQTNIRSQENMKDETWTERRSRFAEKENEILKSDIIVLSERIGEFESRVRTIQAENDRLSREGRDQSSQVDDMKIQLDQSQKVHNACLKECESYRAVLWQFSEQSTLDGDTAQLLASLQDLYENVDARLVMLECCEETPKKYEGEDSSDGSEIAMVGRFPSTSEKRERSGEVVQLREQVCELMTQIEKLQAKLGIQRNEIIKEMSEQNAKKVLPDRDIIEEEIGIQVSQYAQESELIEEDEEFQAMQVLETSELSTDEEKEFQASELSKEEEEELAAKLEFEANDESDEVDEEYMDDENSYSDAEANPEDDDEDMEEEWSQDGFVSCSQDAGDVVVLDDSDSE